MRLLCSGKLDDEREREEMLIRGSSVVLWISQNMEDEYSYNLAL